MGNGKRFADGRTSDAHLLYLLLFFICGALIARFAPAYTSALLMGKWLFPALLLSVALLSSCMIGLYLIPVAALLLGADFMRQMAELGLPGRADMTAWFGSLALMLLPLPVFYALAQGGMRLAEECFEAYLRRDRASRGSFLSRELFLWGLAAGAAALYVFWI